MYNKIGIGMGCGIDYGFMSDATVSPLLNFFTNFYKLADTSDSIGSATLTNTNTVTFAAGKIGNAANFVSASSQDLRLNSTTILPSGTSRSLGMWFDPTATSLSTGHGFFSVAQAGAPISGSPMFILGTGHVANKLYLYQGGAYHDGSTTLSASTWYCVFYVFDASTNTNTVYLNGNVEISGYVHADNNLSQTMYIGSGFSAAWDGMVDACGIATNKVATSDQIAAFYNSGSGVEPPF